MAPLKNAWPTTLAVRLPMPPPVSTNTTAILRDGLVPASASAGCTTPASALTEAARITRPSRDPTTSMGVPGARSSSPVSSKRMRSSPRWR